LRPLSLVKQKENFGSRQRPGAGRESATGRGARIICVDRRGVNHFFAGGERFARRAAHYALKGAAGAPAARMSPAEAAHFDLGRGRRDDGPDL